MEGREISKLMDVRISKIVVDKEIYPRDSYDPQVAKEYSNAMVAQAKFPSIVLAWINNKYYLVDGNHRIEAYKLLNQTEIRARVVMGWNKRKAFEEAIKMNVTHGKSLSSHEKRLVALKLQRLKYKQQQISELIRVPMDDLNQFIEQKLINTITNEPIRVERTILPTKQLPEIKKSENWFTVEESENEEEGLPYLLQISLLTRLIKIIELGELDMKNNKVKSLIEKLKDLLI